MEFSKATHKECSPITLCEVLLLHKFQTWRRSEFLMWQLSGRRHIYQRELCTKCISFRPLCMARSLKRKTELIIFVSKLCDVGSYLRNVSEWNHCHEVTLRSPSCALNYVIVHHHKHQGVEPLIRSVPRVTAANSNVSSIFQLFSFLVVCSSMISNGFGFVAFFASVETSSVCFLSCPVCL